MRGIPQGSGGQATPESPGEPYRLADGSGLAGLGTGPVGESAHDAGDMQARWTATRILHLQPEVQSEGQAALKPHKQVQPVRCWLALVMWGGQGRVGSGKNTDSRAPSFRGPGQSQASVSYLAPWFWDSPVVREALLWQDCKAGPPAIPAALLWPASSLLLPGFVPPWLFCLSLSTAGGGHPFCCPLDIPMQVLRIWCWG